MYFFIEYSLPWRGWHIFLNMRFYNSLRQIYKVFGGMKYRDAMDMSSVLGLASNERNNRS